ncbi:MAG: hypothetical protein HONBIEJF_00260 [Fimbriimonadaceae bacterium]|nr:hypothetical protein [Fimbriimonadaceae bacterium]
MTFLITLQQDREGGYLAQCPAVPGIEGRGATLDEAEYHIFEALNERLGDIVSAGWHPQVIIREIELPFGIEQGALLSGEADLMA